MAKVNRPITLSGKVFPADKAIPGNCQDGDVRLWCRLDSAGRSAVFGRHTNYGYSGFFKAAIFDGKKWRNFKIWNFVNANIRQYKTQREKCRKLEMVIEQIQHKRGLVATWGNRTYELGDLTPALEAQ